MPSWGPVRPLPLLVCALLLAAGCGEAETRSSGSVDAAIADWRWAPRDELPRQAQAVTERRAAEEPEPDPDPEPPAETTPAPEPPPPSEGTGPADDALIKAEVLKNGVALPPLESPPEVRAIFEAGNTIARSPYKWGGGHGKWQDNG